MIGLRYYLYTLRPPQWIKNFFIFLPLVFSHKFAERHACMSSLAAFLCFCAMASSCYVLNDLVDLKTDKLHPLKKLRPLASGKIHFLPALALAFALFIMSLLGAFALKSQFGIVLLLYAILNVAYSLFLRDVVIVDVMCIGIFFLLRVTTGAIVIDAEISHWLMICTAVLALFIGFNKRRHELKLMGRLSIEHRSVLERYNVYFIDQMIAVLTASVVIFYTLYTVDQRTVDFFGSSSLIFTVPFVYYGVFRYLYIVHKIGKGGDPTRIVLSDHKLAGNIFLWLVITLIIIHFHL